jgi:hypothetical protein
MNEYNIKVSYNFVGTVTVRANSVGEAKTIIEKDFGCVIGNINTSNASYVEDEVGVFDWDISMHPEKVNFIDVRKK